MIRLTLLGSVLLLLLSWSCRKELFITDSDAKLEFTTDTLTFDTVFTSIGSATRNFKIKNPHKRSIRIERIELVNGSSSIFRINVDGLPGFVHEDLVIAPEDSMYVFVEVTIDPNAASMPFVLTEEIRFVTNGNDQRVTLEAWGQNAHFITWSALATQTWVNDLPYVLRGRVVVDSGETLTIEKGVRVYVHAYTDILVSGTLVINGTADEPVTFEGDRLEPFFDDLPGQWEGIYILRGSTGNIIQHTQISESNVGLVIGPSASPDSSDFHAGNIPDLTLQQSIIRDCRFTGILGFYASINAENVLVHSCGGNNIGLTLGGSYFFDHCTFANYGALGLEHKDAVFAATNWFEFAHHIQQADLNLQVTNSVIHGNIAMGSEPWEGELVLDTLDENLAQFNILFDHCVLRTNKDVSEGPQFKSILNKLTEPVFVDPYEEDDYHPVAGSPLIGAALSGFVAEDLYGANRPDPPSIGAIEPE